MLESWGLQGWPGFMKYLRLEFGSTLDAPARELRDTLIRLLSPEVPAPPSATATSPASPALTSSAPTTSIAPPPPPPAPSPPPLQAAMLPATPVLAVPKTSLVW